jgi:3-methylcrotonyl-CoA carboxylase alpha subunit/acetyl-CoA/propionyl-CoA carboxylase biotin carboxyl carrier protein
VRIGPAPAAQSYLSIPALTDAAARSGADAVHPGYGFLSERPEFARAVVEAGLVFVGPPAAVMESMGRKDRAREIAIDAGVPVLPAADLSMVDVETSSGLADIGRQVGFPLLVKAAAGGGGKGMRIVATPAGLADAVAAARRESMAAFGDDTMLFERYIEHGRHIEVQVLGDEAGTVVHLFERDCSVQRRHQKVLEEAPATTVSVAVREKVRSAALALARQVAYVNAGTVEFLVSGEDAYFLEMNTRLQVEHPVTELVTGRDLVALQLLIAQGEPLPFGQDDVVLAGHAIEARVYAEDPRHGFLPQAGVAELVAWPEAARVDAALESGDRVGTHYDPMLGKVICWGRSREAARRGLVGALDDSAILGLTTNLGFLRSLAVSREFREATIDTAWLDNQPDSEPTMAPPEAVWVLAAWALATDGGETATGPMGVRDGWRLAGPSAGIPVSLSVVEHDAHSAPSPRLLRVHPHEAVVVVDGRQISVRGVRRDRARYWVEIEGRVHVAHVVVGRHRVLAAYRGQSYGFQLPDAFGPTAHLDVGDGSVGAPMPGTVLAVHAEVGAQVELGDTLVVMEAMKMELSLTAPFAGHVTAVDAAVGDQVQLGAALVTVQPEPGPKTETAAETEPEREPDSATGPPP